MPACRPPPGSQNTTLAGKPVGGRHQHGKSGRGGRGPSTDLTGDVGLRRGHPRLARLMRGNSSRPWPKEPPLGWGQPHWLGETNPPPGLRGRSWPGGVSPQKKIWGAWDPPPDPRGSINWHLDRLGLSNSDRPAPPKNTTQKGKTPRRACRAPGFPPGRSTGIKSRGKTKTTTDRPEIRRSLLYPGNFRRIGVKTLARTV
ncbi:MAG: hypothetical protein CM15mP77_4200 [Synechococcus sp.]|nr:MAG: hypothetical protein CM15mP77_4200 [Synechococcus sp.]